ncbi:PIG-X [Chaetomium sp. MPI-SDFR-AT-0129]|nr:PIG-X [Chaetomium sp. MPI-SDFR-AT-0129]
MRERITFIQKLGDSLEPSALTVDSRSGTINGPEIRAVREDRLTLAHPELPHELQTLTAGARDLHIRWVSTDVYGVVSPLLARLPPGFHLFYAPARAGADDLSSNELCLALGDIFGGISCTSLTESFTSLGDDSFQYYQGLDSLSQFIRYAKHRLCSPTDTSCSTRLDALSGAGSLDITWEAARNLLQITALWPYERQQIHATAQPPRRTEVGILSTDKPKTLEAHEIGISGLLTVLGQDSKPSPTMFTFPSRHRDAESAFSAGFLNPTGLHPTLQLRLTSTHPPPFSPSGDNSDDNDYTTAACHPYAYLTLPRGIFADKYQLSDPLFLASKNLSTLRHTTQPVDLEAPEYVLPQWGSAILLQLADPSPVPSLSSGSEWTAEIPLHLRYLAPSAGTGGYSAVSVPYPAVFWACEPGEDERESAAEKFPPMNPFEKTHLGYDELFAAGTVFWHVEPQPAVTASSPSLVNEVRVPVLDLDRAEWVGAGTTAAVVIGFAWVVWRLAGVWKSGGGNVVGETREAKQKKTQ